MNASFSPSGNWAARVSIILLALLSHGWILINDGRYLDATYFEYFFEAGRYDILLWNFAGVALRPWLWLMSPLVGSSSAGWILKLVEVLSLMTIGLIVHDGARRYAHLLPNEALGLAAITITFPVYASAVMSNTVIYFFPTALFFSGWHILIGSSMGPARAPWRYSTSLFMITLSFLHNSLLVFHYAFVVLLFTQTAHPAGVHGLRASATTFLRRHTLLIVLPPIFFFLRHLSFILNPIPPFTVHNAVSLNPLTVGKALLHLINEGVVVNLLAALGNSLFLMALIPALLVSHAIKRQTGDAEWRRTTILMGFGLLFLLAALFPYAAAAKGVPVNSLGSRYFIQSGFGVALLLIAAIRALPDSLCEMRGTLMATLTLAFALVGIDSYLMWQARWAKDRATIQALAGMAPLAPGTVVLWDDQMRIGAEVYRSFELSWFLQKAWVRQAWYPLYAGDRDLSYLTTDPNLHTIYRDGYLLADFVWNGCTAPLVVEAKVPRETDRQIARHYLMARFAGGKALESYLESLVTVTVGQSTCGLALPEKKP
ncbi:MAG: hypothetical protein HZC25_15625 [Rhodospirillales bacterium]|nr:hypothetical protein [Rhodospirillales bacterium]